MNNSDADKNRLLTIQQFIEEANFNHIINRLTIIERWSRKHAEEAVIQYKRFLFLNKKYGSWYALPPSTDIDHAWHAHILYTRDYFEFCQEVFGEYLHHRPHRGFSGPLTIAKIHDDYEKNTQRLYKLEYGEYIYEIRSSLMDFWCKIKRAFYFAKI